MPSDPCIRCRLHRWSSNFYRNIRAPAKDGFGWTNNSVDEKIAEDERACVLRRDIVLGRQSFRPGATTTFAARRCPVWGVSCKLQRNRDELAQRTAGR